ncbi:MAG: hypothetical protein ACRDD7_03290 [Peptostreptococcaceae bacterium]
MESRDNKESLKKLILDMAHKEIENNASTKGAYKYFEGNVDKVINNNIKNMTRSDSSDLAYAKILSKGSNQENVMMIVKLIKKEEIFKSKNELMKFAKFIGLNVNSRGSYSQILKRVSKHIYINKNVYSKKYVLYKRGNIEYVLEPEKLKNELVESYKSKTREDMKSIAKLLNLNVKEEEGAEDIRKKVINYIIKEKLNKKRK